MRTSHGLAILSIAAVLATVLVILMAPAVSAMDTEESRAPGRAMAQQAIKGAQSWNTTDHSRHAALQKTFNSGPEITQACLQCHNDAAAQFHKTIHWTWVGYSEDDGTEVGKSGYSLNNFCIATNKGADKGCFSCHPGWGKKTETINCLVCHGQSDLNWSEAFDDLKYFMTSDDPDDKEMIKEVQAEIQQAAQSIGMPGRKNCGGCHFNGGGGDGVKHGDLDTSLAKPNKALDVHMGLDGQNFDCVRCHTTVNHNVAGRVYTVPAALDRKSLIEDDLASKITCESCHSRTPHKAGSKPNDHTDKVACQSCHIARYARVNPTKMSWDWSQAGKLKDGKPFKTKGPFGKEDYLSIKGQMKWDKNVTPEYFWYNGSIDHMTLKDTIDPSKSVAVSHPVGSREDANARIYPFKVHRGVQPYDKVHKNLVVPLLSGPNGYWTHLDWQKALSKGMEAYSMPYSGEFDFVETTYVFPTTHMVAPKEETVSCSECHTREDGRLAKLSGFYMPGRDYNRWINTLGWVAVLGSLLGVSLHGLGRIFTNGNGRKEK